MLGKLIKYEFRSTYRVFLVMYGVLLGFATLGRLSIGGIESGFGDNRYLQMLFGITIFGYVVVIFSTIIITMFIIVQRFYRNLTGDEGYLMHTLPVSTHSLLQAKLVVAVCWELLSILAVFLSIFVLCFQPRLFSEMGMFFKELGEMLRVLAAEVGAGKLWLNGGLGISAAFITIFNQTLMIYAAICIGHTFKKRRVLGSVLAYLGLMVVAQVITGVITSTIDFGATFIGIDIIQAAQIVDALSGTFGMLAIINIGFGCAWYFVSHYVLTSQLNLE